MWKYLVCNCISIKPPPIQNGTTTWDLLPSENGTRLSGNLLMQQLSSRDSFDWTDAVSRASVRSCAGRLLTQFKRSQFNRWTLNACSVPHSHSDACFQCILLAQHQLLSSVHILPAVRVVLHLDLPGLSGIRSRFVWLPWHGCSWYSTVVIIIIKNYKVLMDDKCVIC